MLVLFIPIQKGEKMFQPTPILGFSGSFNFTIDRRLFVFSMSVDDSWHAFWHRISSHPGRLIISLVIAITVGVLIGVFMKGRLEKFYAIVGGIGAFILTWSICNHFGHVRGVDKPLLIGGIQNGSLGDLFRLSGWDLIYTGIAILGAILIFIRGRATKGIRGLFKRVVLAFAFYAGVNLAFLVITTFFHVHVTHVA